MLLLCSIYALRSSEVKDIADFLGHWDTRLVGLYAKFDTRSLRKVAAFNLKGL
jgi:hypothetical protein